MSLRFVSSIRYNNIGPAPSTIAEVQHCSQLTLVYAKEFFPGACYGCGAMPAVTGARVLCCAGCQLVSYCNKNCQKQDWKIHKFACKKFPVEMGKNIIVRKTESICIDCDSLLCYQVCFQRALHEIVDTVEESDDSLKEYAKLDGVERIFTNARVCNICREARKEMLFDCRCCSVSYCSESHRMEDTKHLSNECELLYGCAMANWYLTQHLQLQIPDGLLNEANLNDGIKFEKVSKLFKYSSDKWLEALVHLINERLTFPLTLHHVLKNLKLGEERKVLSEITSLTIHIVHSKPMLDPRMWEFMLHQLPNLNVLNLTFINKHMKLNNHYNINISAVERCSDCKQKQRVINYDIQPVQYHEYFSFDEYAEPDVVAVFDTDYELLIGEILKGENINKAEHFTSMGNMTYSKHTVVILTSLGESKLEECVKNFHDARPVKVLLPVQENPAASRSSILMTSKTVVNHYRYVCCLQGNH